MTTRSGPAPSTGDTQLALFAPAAPVMKLPPEEEPAVRIRRELERRLGGDVRVTLTRNRTTLVSARRRAEGTAAVRLHVALTDLDTRELDALADFVRGRRRSRDTLRRAFDRRLDAIEAARPAALRRSRARRVTAGDHHDLAEILEEVRAAYFPELPAVDITWSGRVGEATRRIRLGSWNKERRLIRVHRRLDAAEVPRHVVAGVVHHELCHAAVDPVRGAKGRTLFHGPEFRTLERKFAHFRRARAWERAHRTWLFGDAITRHD